LFKYDIRELLGLDREVQNIRGSLKIETAKKVQLLTHISKEKNKLEYLENNPSIKETISKVLDKDVSLSEKIKTLFREQGITLVTVLTAFGMTIGFIVELLTPKVFKTSINGNNNDPKNNISHWIRNKIKALASLLGKLAGKLGSALPGILGSIISWILNRAKEVLGWVSQNLWSLILAVGALIYTYFITRK